SNIQLKYSNYVAFSHFHGYAVNNPGKMQKIQKYSLNRSKKEKILGGRVYHSDFVEISEYRGLIYVTRKTLSLT
ncbi:hypothetical protein CDL27_10970, partial [Mediterraneibacter gnavus]|uniref:hypothetical protein n=1 Tax=Mediterraneibacter gnavus TaxID=33038 RepID=UPI000CBB2F52